MTLQNMRRVWQLAAGLVALAGSASADDVVQDWIDGATPLVDMRLRYEAVDDASKPRDANAVTLRARLGVKTGTWEGFSLLGELDGIWDIDKDFNSTRNGKTLFAAVADPEMATLNRLQLTYASDFDTAVTVGRQRLQFGDQRFVGNAGWRQHEQTFDAVAVANTSLPGLTATYAYVGRVNRVYGNALPVPSTGPAAAWHCDCHLLDVAWSGVPGLNLEGFALLLDLSQRTGPGAARLATAKLSTATFGFQAGYRLALPANWSLQFMAEYAHQSAYRNNPLAIDLDYWRGEAVAGYAGLAGTLGYEVMQGNGGAGLSTPLATIHSFDGWADLFLTTPANGLDDLYFKVACKIPFVARALDIDSASATLIHRDFSADRIHAGLGTEWDAALEFGYGKASLLLQYANYQGSGVGLGGFADKSIGWVQLAYKL